MFKAFAVVLILVLVLYACTSNKTASKNTCLQAKIETFKQGDCKTGLSVKEYIFSGKHVYAFDPGNCGADMTTEVIDENCKSLGYLGGITGNTEIEGKDFSTAQFVKSLYE